MNADAGKRDHDHALLFVALLRNTNHFAWMQRFARLHPDWRGFLPRTKFLLDRGFNPLRRDIAKNRNDAVIGDSERPVKLQEMLAIHIPDAGFITSHIEPIPSWPKKFSPHPFACALQHMVALRAYRRELHIFLAFERTLRNGRPKNHIREHVETLVEIRTHHFTV